MDDVLQSFAKKFEEIARQKAPSKRKKSKKRVKNRQKMKIDGDQNRRPKKGSKDIASYKRSRANDQLVQSSMQSMKQKRKLTKKQQHKVVDPSVKYLKKPTSCPTVMDAKRFFRKNCRKTFQIKVDKKRGWRTVAKLSVRGTPPVIGLFAPKSHVVVPIPNSPVHHQSINKAIQIIQDALIN